MASPQTEDISRRVTSALLANKNNGMIMKQLERAYKNPSLYYSAFNALGILEISDIPYFKDDIRVVCTLFAIHRNHTYKDVSIARAIRTVSRGGKPGEARMERIVKITDKDKLAGELMRQIRYLKPSPINFQNLLVDLHDWEFTFTPKSKLSRAKEKWARDFYKELDRKSSEETTNE